MYKLKHQIITLADDCLPTGKQERPENLWMQRMYERFRKESGNLRKAEADALLYRKMYDSFPERSSDTLKIRYWRTGHHLPGTRKQCIDFGQALGLSKEEQKYLIQAYYDRCDLVFEVESEDATYQERKGKMELLLQEYLDKVHPSLKWKLYRYGIDVEHHLRHLYYTDAKSYVQCKLVENIDVERHIVSINYESEFSRQIKLLGEIPRRTMIRHLLLLSIPFVNEELLSERLKDFGYLSLCKEHTQVDGSRLDQLLIGMLNLYEDYCTGKDPMECLEWMHHAYAILDHHLEEKKNQSLRFLYFKALKSNRENHSTKGGK